MSLSRRDPGLRRPCLTPGRREETDVGNIYSDVSTLVELLETRRRPRIGSPFVDLLGPSVRSTRRPESETGSSSVPFYGRKESGSGDATRTDVPRRH